MPTTNLTPLTCTALDVTSNTLLLLLLLLLHVRQEAGGVDGHTPRQDEMVVVAVAL